MTQRTERMIGDTKIISNPAPADILPFLNKKRIIVHVSHPHGSMYGNLTRARFRQNVYRIWFHGTKPGTFGYITFAIEQISELNTTPGTDGPNIYVRS